MYVIFIVQRNHYFTDNIACVQKEKEEKKKWAMKQGGGVVLGLENKR